MAGGEPEGADLLARIEAGGLVVGPKPLVALLSGGRDSVCMLDLAVRTRGPEAVTVVHVDYGLRPDSHDDADFCVSLCEARGVEILVERPVRPDTTGNLQAWARDFRYATVARLAEARDGTIVTGHTADDQVETILYRLASSPSRRALLGMKERDGRLARPLLGTTRAEVTAYDEWRGLPWREDSTNEEEGYARNRVRHGLLPELGAIHPAAAANVLRTAALLRDEAEVLDGLVAAELDGSGEAPRGRIAQARFAALAPALRRLVLQRLADAAAGRPVPGAARFADQVAGLTRGGSRLDLGDGVRAVLEGGVLRAEREV